MINFLSSIYWALAASGTPNTDDPTPKSKVAKVLNEIRELMDDMVLPFLYVVGAAGMIYGIWLGVSYSKSEGDARGEAKKRIINFLIGFVCIIVLLVLLALFVKHGKGVVDWLDGIIYKD